MYEVVTVATHNEGKLDELINNELNIPVTVLGMGKKWTGFRMKYELMYEHIQSMDDNKIMIFLDGFDSNIVGHPSNAIQKFKEKNSKLLFSKDFFKNNERLRLNRSIHAFTSCNDDKIIINSGMYMGYVKYLKPFLQYALSQTCKDDQRNANKSYTIVKLYIDNEPRCVSLYGRIEDWDVSNVTNMSKLFLFCKQFNEDISNWDTSNVTDMKDMFNRAKSFNQPIGGWDTSKVTRMSRIFYKADNFNIENAPWYHE